MSAIISFVKNPGTISQRSLEASNLNPNYRQALRQLYIKLIDGILYYHKSITRSKSFVCLQLVPTAICNLVFIAFHSNPIGGHLNVVRTFHCIRLRFYWLNMYSYFSCMCNLCPGCVLTNPTGAQNPANWFVTFPSRHRFWYFTSTGIKRGKNLASKGLPTT
jgi:hypothetical protein